MMRPENRAEVSSAVSEQRLTARYQYVKTAIAAAVRGRGRNPDDIAVLWVSKYAAVAEMAAAVRCGARLFGENRVSAALDKHAALSRVLEPELFSEIQWHMIGHLQTNKAAKICRIAALVQSVDSFRLAQTLSAIGVRRQNVVPILAEINIGAEVNKYGLKLETAAGELERWETLPGIALRGIMGMAPFYAEAEPTRPFFRALARLFTEYNDRRSRKGRESLTILSMGMSNDFVVAVEEGATMVRVGSVLFGD